MRRIVPLIVVVAMAVIALSPASAQACSVKEEQHCYSVAVWEMHGAEEVRGAYSEIETYYAKVPNWGNEFIDNELWVIFPSATWVEGGVTAGYETGGPENLRYFWAHSLKGAYSEYIYPEGPPYNAWAGFYIWEPNTQGQWCVKFPWDGSPDFCYNGYPGSSRELNEGLEFATTTSSGADDNGRAIGYDQHMEDNWFYGWNSAFGARNLPLCIVMPAPGYTTGSIAFSAPGC
jgi:hypothetical protein